ncbi:META domain-containing protein [Mycetocola manganoxydans]|uniref:META domain-containing protein n=1 Tax=Mycetocola manganoxydans TaxID=699879 RepID=A0A3L6ZUZ3_9MICO|nr:META domain-containing protein [Mycetocola manganoxydans]RLP71485.1 META domain-containing protein [Mycetocola manganoxydans]GHD46790.1 META domain-containing protein [Mycetocola manganoxydans]
MSRWRNAGPIAVALVMAIGVSSCSQQDPFIGSDALPLGRWVETDGENAAFLAIGSKGTFTGSDGCNTLTGTWEVADDGSIRFPATVATERWCEGMDPWLGSAVEGRVVDGVMTLESEDGTVLGELRAR